MTNDIKEILEWLSDKDIYVEDNGYQYKRISLRETKILLDYIKDLQQQIEEMQEEIDNLKNPRNNDYESIRADEIYEMRKMGEI